MRDAIPHPESTRGRLIEAGLRMFGARSYAEVEVDAIAAAAGVTVGALYHHFRSKQGFYGLLRDEMTQRVVDRVEAAAEAAPAELRLRAAALAAYDGILRIRAGKLLTEPDPRGAADGLAGSLSAVAARAQPESATMVGAILAAAVRAALVEADDSPQQQALARSSLLGLLLAA